VVAIRYSSENRIMSAGCVRAATFKFRDGDVYEVEITDTRR